MLNHITGKVYAIFTGLYLVTLYFVFTVWQQKQSVEWLLVTFTLLSAVHFYLYKNGSFSLKEILIPAIVFKIVILFSDPFLSDDVYRYLWDGHVMLNGINPYSYPPVSEQLFALRQDFIYFDLINHPQVTTVYPPLAQLIFTISYVFHPSLIAFRIILFVFDIVALLTCIKIDEHFKLNRKLVFVFALHPLILFEVHSSAHIDMIYVSLILISYYFYLKKDKTKLILSNFLASMTRATAPWLLIATKSYRLWGFLLFIPLIVFGVYLNQIEASGLKAYSHFWYFNNPLHDLFREILMSSYHQIENWYGFTRFIKLIVFILVLIVFAFFYPFKRNDYGFSILYISLFFIVSSTTIQPWYALILIPFAVLQKQDAILIFTYSIFFSYHVLIDYFSKNDWSLDYPIYFLEYTPVIIALLFKLNQRKQVKIT